ncbi:FR47-like protein [Purpureocillium takamizusanense]|uniref:FR47-like protein n=1 Tax=Purpureocillium takamizusanense TaxID=2060973 RepID=A0A9Q8QI17_9HYPO|nr:FR47-like protein [Purpureocillium takamizusanense]UNI19229.1 FR47-like protein [Purpureocillium takamizusanense]
MQNVPTIRDFIVAGGADQAPGTYIPVTEADLAATLHFAAADDQSGPNVVAVAGTAAHHRFAWPLLIVVPEGDVAGMAIYFFNYTTWKAAPGVCLEEFYVAPRYRRRGYGKLLIEAMAREALKAGCVKMEWLCLKDNERALAFYDKLGAARKDDWVALRVDETGIARLAAGDGPAIS